MSPVVPRPIRRHRRVWAALTAFALALVLPVLAPTPAHAADGWIVGTTKQSTILNCFSVVQGNPYAEVGISVTNAYYGTAGVTPTVGQSSYMTTAAYRIGTHCSTPIIFPKFQLPSGVVFDTSQAIECYYKAPGASSQTQVTAVAECPQWSQIASDGRYTSTQSGWSGGWPLPSDSAGNNDSIWEFIVPIKATTVQSGSKIRSVVDVADGNDNPTLTPEVSFYAPAGTSVSVPGAPTGVVGQATGATTAEVSFNPPASNGGATITSYGIECSSTNGGTTRTANYSSSPADLTGLTPAKTYHCRVRAQNSAGWGTWSGYSATFTTPAAATVPGAPTGVTAQATGPTTAKVSFTAPANNGGAAISGYGTECASTNGGTTRTASTTGSPANLTGLTSGKTYHCRVRAQNSAGWSTWSAYSANFTTAVTVPQAPTGVTAQATGTTTAKVSFTAPANNGGAAITGYDVECKNFLGSAVVSTASGTASPLNVTGFSPGGSYQCRVRAKNSAGPGTWSAYSWAFFTATANPPGAPTGVSAQATGPATVKVGFTAPANNGGVAITSYDVECVRFFVDVRAASGTTSPVTVTGLAPGNTYECRVRANNSVGPGAWSVSSTVTTPAGASVPGAPIGVTAQATGATTAKVSFSVPASNGGAAITAYNSECSSTNGGATRAVTSAGSPANLTGLTPEKAYQCRVRAQNSSGWGAWSTSLATFTTPSGGAPDTTAPNTRLVKAAPTWALKRPKVKFSSGFVVLGN